MGPERFGAADAGLPPAGLAFIDPKRRLFSKRRSKLLEIETFIVEAVTSFVDDGEDTG